MDSFFDRALAAARQLGASDIHLKPETRPILRIGGELRTLEDVPPLARDFLHGLAMSLLNDRRREVLERVGDVSVALPTTSGMRLRVHISQQRAGTGVVLRLIPREVPSLDGLGLPEPLRDDVRALLLAPGAGLVIVSAGPGGGKTTTLAAMVDDIASQRSCHIVTLEDPVEILLHNRKSLVVQREVGIDVPNTAAGLRAAGRQDADVLVVGEIADRDVAELALAAAETERLVLAGVPAASAAHAMARIVGLWEPASRAAARERLDKALRGVFHQRLVPKTLGGRGKARIAQAELVPGGAAVVETDGPAD